ncbi:hypothetical protein [Streptomyces sp. NPDC059597]|uniref:hypothetical protein n=1 Tax=Streptomyces sp. NPDC059597 TaxID=3346879 RepID=UPI0036AF7F57
MTTVLQISARAGHTVNVTARSNSRDPYGWECMACDEYGAGYAALPFARDDAQMHADTCTPDS